MKLFEGLNGKKKSLILVIMGIVGMVLILFGSNQNHKKTNTEENSEKNLAAEEYITSLENKIGNITEQITGSNRVRVIVNIASGSEFEYLFNEETKENTSSKEYVTIRGENGKDSPILLKEIYPKIVGVSIACRGGDLPEVQEKLIRVISTAYDLSSNRICIVGIP